MKEFSTFGCCEKLFATSNNIYFLDSEENKKILCIEGTYKANFNIGTNLEAWLTIRTYGYQDYILRFTIEYDSDLRHDDPFFCKSSFARQGQDEEVLDKLIPYIVNKIEKDKQLTEITRKHIEMRCK